MAIWLTSDWHINHDKEFIYRNRGCDNVKYMNAAILNLVYNCVQEDDDLYILGDVFLGSTEDEKIKSILESIPCRIHIIRGNHDSDRKVNAYASAKNVVEIEYATIIKYNKWKFYLSHYPTKTANTGDKEKPLHRRLWNLCGHSHTCNRWCDYDMNSYHVEVDAHNCYPVSLDRIIKEIKEREEMYKGPF